MLRPYFIPTFPPTATPRTAVVSFDNQSIKRIRFAHRVLREKPLPLGMGFMTAYLIVIRQRHRIAAPAFYALPNA